MAKKLTNILNKSAIANWSGYIYQGLCGLYHALTLIRDGVNPNEYKLWLDAYEDFSIEQNGLMISLHQCKCDTHSPNSYIGEFEKMYKKKNHLKNRISNDCSLMFHSNHNFNIPEAYNMVKKYSYHNNSTCCPPTQIIELITDLVDNILRVQPHYSDKNMVTASLIALVDTKVLEVHDKYLKGRKKLFNIAQNYADISFQDIHNVLQQEIVVFNSEDIYKLWKTTFLINLNELIDSACDMDTAKIDFIVEKIETMSDKELQVFFQRINPDIKVLNNSISFVNTINKDRVDSLLNVINELEQLDNDLLCWHNKNKWETPTSITFKRSNLKRYCSDIINNSANLNSIWIYDWMVGDGVFDKVDNIFEQTNSIVKTPDQNNSSTSIFCQKNVGILTINDMKNGNYN